MRWSTLVSVVLVLTVAAYAAAGWRRGLLRSLVSAAGLIGGGALAMWLFPRLLRRLPEFSDHRVAQVFLAVGTVIVLASIGEALAITVTRPLWNSTRRSSLRWLDSALGGVAAVVVSSVLVWLLAGALRGAPEPELRRAVAHSSVVAALDRMIPARVGDAFSGFESALEARGFPRIFATLAPEPAAPIQAPDTAAARTPGVRAAAASVVRIVGVAPSCQHILDGSGWVVSNDHVVTNAHVVAGTRHVTVQVGGSGPKYPARVVLFDARRDVAVLDVPGLPAPPLPEGPPLIADADAAALGFPYGGAYTVSAARIREQFSATGRDIYGRTAPARSVYALRVVVRPGNSGGPLVDSSGRVVGVVFAMSLENSDTGYALTLAEIDSDLAAAATATAPTSTGACAAA